MFRILVFGMWCCVSGFSGSVGVKLLKMKAASSFKSGTTDLVTCITSKKTENFKTCILMRTALFWVITQWVVVISYHYLPHNNLEERSTQLPCRRSLKSHVLNSMFVSFQLCQARGFVCELCASQEVIFPWQLGKVARCSSCGACFHTACWTPSPCPRCTRLSARRQSFVSDSKADMQDVWPQLLC